MSFLNQKINRSWSHQMAPGAVFIGLNDLGYAAASAIGSMASFAPGFAPYPGLNDAATLPR